MSFWLYASNADPSQRFTEFEFIRDDATTAIIQQGVAYSLTDAEASRIQRYVVLLPATSGGVPNPGGGGGPSVGQGVGFVAINDDLPPSAVGHPVVLVLADDEASGQATLRYWSGVDWIIIGLAGGGTISSDFIDVVANLAGISSGKTLIWNAGSSQFTPGSPS